MKSARAKVSLSQSMLAAQEGGKVDPATKKALEKILKHIDKVIDQENKKPLVAMKVVIHEIQLLSQSSKVSGDVKRMLTDVAAAVTRSVDNIYQQLGNAKEALLRERMQVGKRAEAEQPARDNDTTKTLRK